MKTSFFIVALLSSWQLFSQGTGEDKSIRPLNQFVGYYNVGTKPNKPFFKSRWYLKDGDLFTIYDSDVDRKFEPYIDGHLNYNVVYDEKDLPVISENDTTYYVVLKFKNDQLDQFKIFRPRKEWSTDLYGYRITELDGLAINAEEQMTRELTTDHFRFTYSSPDEAFIQNFSRKIESLHDELLNEFGIQQLPVTTYKIYPDIETYHHGVLTPGAPTWQKGRVWTENEIKLVSPTYLNTVHGESISDDLLIHEYVHILHWNIAGDPNLIPKWLWEGVALYKGCCQWEHLEQLEYLQKEKFTSLREINGQAELQYQLGYSIIEFIVEKWDWTKVLSLLKNNGDIKESLDLSSRAFEREFYAFLKEKHLSK